MSAHRLSYAVYDCFTQTRFGGNIGGIVFDAAGLDDQTMARVAAEIGAPVTGFVTDVTGDTVKARFFMPAGEIAMCGPVTVGLFSHFFQKRGLEADQVFTLKVPAGDFTIEALPKDGSIFVRMALSTPTISAVSVDKGVLSQALGSADSNGIEAVSHGDGGLRHLFVRLSSAEAVAALQPDFATVSAISTAHNAQTVACYAMTGARTLKMRDFCPAVGSNEVPASGTTTAALMGCLVRDGLVAPSGQVHVSQGAEIGRPSALTADLTETEGALATVKVGGQAILSMEGSVYI